MKNYLLLSIFFLSCSNLSENERSNPFDSESKYKLKISFENESKVRSIGKSYTIKAKVESVHDGETVDQSHLVKNYNWITEGKSGKSISKIFTTQNRQTSLKITLKNGVSIIRTHYFNVALEDLNIDFKFDRSSIAYGSNIAFSYKLKNKSGKEVSIKTSKWTSNRQGELSNNKSFSKNDLYAGKHNISLVVEVLNEATTRSFNTSIEIEPIPNISATILSPMPNQSFDLTDPIHFSAMITKGANNQVESNYWNLGDKILSNSIEFNNSKIVFQKGFNTIKFNYSIDDHYLRSDSILIDINYPGSQYAIGSGLNSLFSSVSHNEHSIIKSNNSFFYVNSSLKTINTMNNIDISKIVFYSNGDFINSTNGSIFRMDANANQLSSYTSEPNFKVEYFYIDDDENVYFTESKLSSPFTVYLVKLSSDYQLIWRKNLNDLKSISTSVLNSSNIKISKDNIYVSLYDKYFFRITELFKLNLDGELITNYVEQGAFTFIESDDEGGVYYTTANATTYKRTFTYIDKNLNSKDQSTVQSYFQTFNKYKTSNGIFFDTNTAVIPVFDADFNFIKHADGSHYRDFTIINDEIYACSDSTIYKIDNSFNTIWERKFETKITPYFRQIKELNGQLLVYAELEGKLWELILNPSDGSFISNN